MPYRIDINFPPPAAFDILVELGALDIELIEHALAAIIPDGVTAEAVADALGVDSVAISDAVGRDDGSVWLINPRAIRIGRASRSELRLIDSDAFGTGHHPSTALCIEALEEILSSARIDSMLDVGTGSGILALAALLLGVPKAVGLDIDPEALKAAAENARLNHLEHRLQLILGGPDAVDGQWPLVMANVLAAPLIEMAPALVQRVGRSGRLILSGIHASLETEVRQAYQHRGMWPIDSKTRAGWSVLMLQASW